MVIAHHLIWTVYGWWLPNDPRGSSSHDIRVEPIRDLGELHYGKKSPPPSWQAVRQFHQQAEPILRHEVLLLTECDQAQVAASLAEAFRVHDYTCYACAVMPEHLHLVVRRHRDSAEQMLENLQQTTRDALRAASLRHEMHPVWGGPGWKVFLDSPERIQNTVRYVEENPQKSGLPPQAWPFVTKYDNWLPAPAMRRSGNKG